MGFLEIALIVLYVVICFFLILVVLVQQGRGADIAGAFGGGGTQTAFGARGATTVLHKLTTGAFIGFVLISLALTILGARPHSKSVVKGYDSKPGAAKTAPGQPAPAAAQPAPAAPAAPAANPPAPASEPAKK